ncbi:MAG: hypothetical protein AAGC93_13995 [Cyanobacteria bacterium P01_F01_bin.53]
MLNNTELVEAFVEASLRQKEILLSNTSLRAECVCGVNQLISRQDGVLMKMNLREPVQFWLRRQSTYSSWLSDLLHQHQFLMAEKSSDAHFDAYRYFSIKPGYQLNINLGRELWRSWRQLSRLSVKGTNVSKFQLHTGEENWADIRAIATSNELMFIETTDGVEIMHCLDDTLRWLSYSDPQQLKQVNSCTYAMQH